MSPYGSATAVEAVEDAIRQALTDKPQGVGMSDLIADLADTFSETDVRLAVWHLVAKGLVRVEQDRRFVEAA